MSIGKRMVEEELERNRPDDDDCESGRVLLAMSIWRHPAPVGYIVTSVCPTMDENGVDNYILRQYQCTVIEFEERMRGLEEVAEFVVGLTPIYK